MIATAAVERTPDVQGSMEKLIGLAVFGEKMAAKIYLLMGKLKPEFAELMKEFAQMESAHGTWFRDVAKKNDIEPDKDFADNELGYLLSQVDEHYENGSFESLAILQGFIVESMAIATYDPFMEIADEYEGAREVFGKALEEEHWHVDWITRYLRLRFFDREDEFTALVEKVNVQGVDCVGGSMMNIADYLDAVGIRGADAAGGMMDHYTQLLEDVGVSQKRAAKNVVSLFMPLIRKYRHGEKTK
jgi:rubrerythrin